MGFVGRLVSGSVAVYRAATSPTKVDIPSVGEWFRPAEGVYKFLGLPSGSPFEALKNDIDAVVDLAEFILHGFKWAVDNPDAFALIVAAGGATIAGGIFVVQPVAKRFGNAFADKVANQIKIMTGEDI